MKIKNIKGLKLILLIIVIMLILVMSIFIRRLIIINTLESKVLPYTKTTNAHIRITFENSTNKSIDTYMLGNTEKIVVNYSDGQDYQQLIQIACPENRKLFTTDANGNKVMQIFEEQNKNKVSYIIVNYVDYTTFSTFFEKLHDVFSTRITTSVVNGKECFLFSSLSHTQYVYEKNATDLKIYIDKKTGLPIKVIETLKLDDGTEVEKIMEYKFEFNNVSKEDLKEPNNDNYILK